MRRLAPLVVAAGCLTMAIGSAGAQTLTTVNDPAGSGGGLAPPQVALIGRRMFQTLAPTGTPTVTVFATTRGRAETILLGPSHPRSQADRTAAELITVRGRLRRRGRPVGRALLGLTIWIPNGATSESGVLRRVPKQLAQLGRGTTYNLTLPQPASAVVAVRPLTGIGPISLGESRAALQRTLGPWLLGSRGDNEYALGATELDVGLAHRRTQELVSRDANALLDGIPLRAGYRTLAEHLHGWRPVQCAEEGRMLELSGAGGRVTDLLFKDNRFVRSTSAWLAPAAVRRGRRRSSPLGWGSCKRDHDHLGTYRREVKARIASLPTTVDSTPSAEPSATLIDRRTEPDGSAHVEDV